MVDIQVRNLTKFFVIGENLLDNLSFEIQEGERVAILGRNGCGKTTLFNILTGQMDYDSGEVYVNPNKRLGLISQIPKFPAGYTVEDIQSFEDLKAVAEDITARKDELGFSAFSSAGLDSSSSWRFSGHLTNLPLFYEFRDDNVTSQPATVTGKYLDNFKNIWDLYINNSTCAPSDLPSKTAGDSEAEFAQGKAVFFQNGSWEYANLVTSDDKGFKMNPEDLAMIPIYCGVEGEEKAGLCCGTENCWAVNKNAKEEDIQATLDFMKWVVTSDEGTTMLAEQFGPCPFKNAKTPANVFFADANAYTAAGNYIVTWAFNWTPAVDDWRAGVVDALTQYTVNGGSWDNVKTAFVDGWATQYAKENG